jgi:hypothetical protein
MSPITIFATVEIRKIFGVSSWYTKTMTSPQVMTRAIDAKTMFRTVHLQLVNLR